MEDMGRMPLISNRRGITLEFKQKGCAFLQEDVASSWISYLNPNTHPNPWLLVTKDDPGKISSVLMTSAVMTMEAKRQSTGA